MVLLVLILIGVAATAVFYVLGPGKDVSGPDSNNPTVNDGSDLTKKTEVDSSEAPEKFPSDIPIEAGARITQNYNATTADGRFQATREFESTKTLAENLTLYRNYMTSEGWEVRSTVDQENYKMLFGVKDNTNLQISMDFNSELETRRVTIFFTEVATAQ